MIQPQASETEFFLDPLFWDMPWGLMVVGANNCVQEINFSTEEILGLSRQTILNQDLFVLIPSLKNGWRAFLSDGQPRHIPDVDILSRYYTVDIIAYRDGGAIFLAPKGNYQPNTHRAEAVAALLAHELKNPLSGIRGAAQLLEGRTTAEDKALARLIREESDRIAALIDSYGALGSEEETQPVNINEIMNHSILIAKHGFAAEASIEASFDPSLPEISGRRHQLIQACLNLIKNAVEAGNLVKIRTLYIGGPRVHMPDGSRQRLALAIEVEDNGPGIEPSIAGDIFEPFVSTKRGGRGLGLVQAGQTAADHAGIIEYKSNPTIFRLTLPISLPERVR